MIVLEISHALSFIPTAMISHDISHGFNAASHAGRACALPPPSHPADVEGQTSPGKSAIFVGMDREFIGQNKKDT